MIKNNKRVSSFVYPCIVIKWAAAQEVCHLWHLFCIENVALHAHKDKLKACAAAQFYCRIWPFFLSFIAAYEKSNVET